MPADRFICPPPQRMSVEYNTCPSCLSDFGNMGNHWYYNPSHRPAITDYQYDVATGLLMGDGYIDSQGENPWLTCGMINEEYLSYLHNIFGVLSTGPPRKRKHPQGNVYSWSTRAHPQLSSLLSWYDSGEKVWPNDLQLTETVLKHWYCGDGDMSKTNPRPNLRISMKNEMGALDKVDTYFSRSGLPTPSNCSPQGRIYFTADSSEVLWEYMGDPPPGFEYKWPERFK